MILRERIYFFWLLVALSALANPRLAAAADLRKVTFSFGGEYDLVSGKGCARKRLLPQRRTGTPVDSDEWQRRHGGSGQRLHRFFIECFPRAQRRDAGLGDKTR